MKTPYALAAVLAILIFLYCSACGNFSINDSKEGEDSAATYTVTYHANGATSGTVPAYTKYYEAGQTVTVLVNSGGLMKTDYAFSGWNTVADGSGTTYSATGAVTFIMKKANVTLYAQWTTTFTFINTAADLNAIRGNLAGQYKLMADIDLSISFSAGWTAIGTDTSPFTGTFDGNNHTISKLTVNSAGDYQGLFGYTSGATIQKLNLTGAAVAGGKYVGALAGYSASSTISGCSAAGTSITGTDNVGGLLGYSSGTVTGTSGSYCHTGFTAITGSNNVGGFIGNNAGAVQYCYSSSTVSCNPSSSFGIGGFIGNNTAAISYCYVTGTVTGNYNVGGLVGANSGAVTYSHASNTALVTGTLYTGGLVGWNSAGGPISYCYASNQVVGSGGSYDTGGLVGRNYDAILDCYATGNVSGSVNVAGLVGLLRSPGSVDYCYATGVVSGGYGLIAQMETTCNNSYFNSANTDNGYGTAVSLSNMQLQSTYSGWDFSTIWALSGVINSGYPYLRNIAP